MRAARFHAYGDVDAISIEDVQDPQPGEGEVLLRVRNKRSKVLFEVEDTGPGVPIGDRAFEPYVRGSSHGTVPGIGLGLATVKRLSDSCL